MAEVAGLPREDRIEILAEMLGMRPLEVLDELVYQGEDSSAVVRTISQMWVRADQKRRGKHRRNTGEIRLVGSGGNVRGQFEYAYRPQLHPLDFSVPTAPWEPPV